MATAGSHRSEDVIVGVRRKDIADSWKMRPKKENNPDNFTAHHLARGID